MDQQGAEPAASTTDGAGTPFAAEFALGCDNAAPGRARAWMQQELSLALAGRDVAADVVDDALVVISELVTNAVRSGCRQARLAWQLAPPRLSVAVTDDAPGWPRLRNATPRETSGRGLWIVESLATDTGVDAVAGGKRVWAELLIE